METPRDQQSPYGAVRSAHSPRTLEALVPPTRHTPGDMSQGTTVFDDEASLLGRREDLGALNTTSDGAGLPCAPTFSRTVDVLELVCEAVGCSDKVATLLALRACSGAWAEAVSGVMHRVFVLAFDERNAAHDFAMAPVVASKPAAARLCVVSQPYGAVRHWLRRIPSSVLRACHPRRMAADCKMALAHVRAPSALHFHRNCSAVSDEVAVAIASGSGGAIELLRFDDTTLTATAAAIFAGMASLTKVAVNGLQTLADDALIALARGCQGLRHLDVKRTAVSSDAFVAAAPHMPLLTHLDVSSTSHVADGAICAIAAHCPQLETLNVSDTSGRITDRGISALAEQSVRLTSLNVEQTRGRVTNASVIAVAQRCPQLRHLNVSTTGGAVGDAALEAVARHCPLLESLNVSLASGVTDAGVVAIARSCPGLTEIDMSAIGSGLTAASLVALAVHCEHLRTLDVTLTRRCVTEESLGVMEQHCRNLVRVRMSVAGSDVAVSSAIAVAKRNPHLTYFAVKGTVKKTAESVAAMERELPGVGWI